MYVDLSVCVYLNEEKKSESSFMPAHVFICVCLCACMCLPMLLDDHTTVQKAITLPAPPQLNSAAVNMDFLGEPGAIRQLEQEAEMG